MIRYLKIEGLNGSTKPLEFNFNDDLNLFTGLNGCGKTTILKLLWFVNCGKISDCLHEVDFSSLLLKTDNYELQIVNKGDSYKTKWKSKDDKDEQDLPILVDGIIRRRTVMDFNEKFYPYSESSIFFPTFRRIEGGFSMENRGVRFSRKDTFPLKEALSDLSEDLSSEKHQFIASVSTDDITSMLNREYSIIVRDINELQRKQFDEIRKRIKNKKGKGPNEILDAIESDIKAVEESSKEKQRPFTVLGELIVHIFHKKGISMEGISFGDGQNLISSDKLSAGEKQMLSFLCYNTFSKNKIIFIDEPELSLHPDWQRLLVPTLLKQGNNNQFFIATHSPFIYTKYADKEIILSEDKGGM
jgi:predicted ATP-binding protein involved in virulence